MSYATLNLLLTRFGESELVNATDRSGSGLVDQAAVAQALGSADNAIDAAIGGRYALPLSSVPGLLVDCACDIARYKLYTIEAPQLVRDRYADALATLKQLAGGTMTLQLVDATPAPSTSADVAFVTDERRFTRDSMRGL